MGPSVEFEYEIGIEEYTEASLLGWGLRDFKQRLRRSAPHMLVAIFILIVAFEYGAEGWQSAAIFILGLAILYTSVKSMFLETYLRKHFASTGLAGKRYRAKVDERGIEVIGDEAEWRMKWSHIEKKQEGKIVFSFTAPTVMFIFGKKHISESEQQQLRSLILDVSNTTPDRS